mmetsp:Transcript_428/g.1187  ORF Transcript_428/g.1187 Transcript_428/m.1187 type:complete len:377 (+) Transcript_428:16-1146(+)
MGLPRPPAHLKTINPMAQIRAQSASIVPSPFTSAPRAARQAGFSQGPAPLRAHAALSHAPSRTPLPLHVGAATFLPLRLGRLSAPAPAPRCRAEAAVRAVGVDELGVDELVTELLNSIDGTDAGQAASIEEREYIDSIIEELEEVGKLQQPRPSENPLLFGNYEVGYVSGGAKQRGNPAGGRFRGAIGRAFFKTSGLYQNVIAADPLPLVVNKVAFLLFGFLRGFIALKGTAEVVTDLGDGTDTLRAKFDQPRFMLGSWLLGYGPSSSVVLSTTYLDERIRLGKGGFGSLFVFTRGGKADLPDGQVDASMWEAGKAGSILPLKLAAAAALAAAAWAMLRIPALWGKVLGGGLLLATAALASTLGRGGMENECAPKP